MEHIINKIRIGVKLYYRTYCMNKVQSELKKSNYSIGKAYWYVEQVAFTNEDLEKLGYKEED